MKKVLLLLAVAGVIGFASCSKDETPKDPTQNLQNQVVFDDTNFDITDGSMIYCGDNNVDLLFELDNGDYEVWFEMWVQNGNKLTTGTYVFSGKETPLNISDCDVWDEDSEKDFTGGTVNVVASGNIYTITINCTLSGGGTLIGKYSGSLNWFDESE